MRKIINPCTVDTGRGRRANVFCEINYNQKRLSITGVVGPLSNGNCLGGAGQIDMSFLQDYGDSIKFKDGWSMSKFRVFLKVWREWHLNDMRSACVHQRALGWTYENHRGVWIERPRKVTIIDEYDNGESNNPELVWNEYKGHSCPECGYSIGSAWLLEEVPDKVIEFLSALPDTTITPAWV